MKLSVIIVSYNVKDYLRQCIRSIYNSNLDKNLFEIIVVDNDSHDNSIQELKNNFSKVIIKENSRNLGFSKAVNIGLKSAKGEYICILNPDVILSQNTFSILIEYMKKNKNIACIGPRILNSNGSIQHSCKRSFPTPINALCRLLGLDKIFPNSKIFGKYNLTYLDTNKIQSVDAISGAFMLFEKKIINEVGLFDESFFMFGEDLDYCYRIKSKGYSIVYNPNTEIIHYKGESVKQAPYNMVNIFYSSMLIYFDKYSNNHRYWSFFSIFIKIALRVHKSTAYIRLFLSKIYFSLLDSLSILTAFSIAIYFWYSFSYAQIVDFSIISYHSLLIFNFLISWGFASTITQIYKRNHFTQSMLILSLIIAFLISSTTTYFISSFAYSRAVLLIATFIALFFIIGWRFALKKLSYNRIFNFLSFRNFFERRILIIGADKKTINLINKIKMNPYNEISIIGFTDTKNFFSTKSFLGKVEYLEEIVVKNNITEIITREGYYDSDKIFNIIRLLNKFNLSLKIIPKENNIILGKGRIEEIGGVDLVSYKIPFLERNNILIKRIFDLFLSLFLIILMIPLQLLYFTFGTLKKKTIWGVSGENIDVYYFNSKINFIKIIPLFYQIFLGNISFVGSKILDSNVANPKNILKPGITGPYKLNTNKDDLFYDNKYDYYYLENYSLSLDIEIIFKTLKI